MNFPNIRLLLKTFTYPVVDFTGWSIQYYKFIFYVSVNSNVLYFLFVRFFFHAFLFRLILWQYARNNIRNLHALSNSQTANILHFNNSDYHDHYHYSIAIIYMHIYIYIIYTCIHIYIYISIYLYLLIKTLEKDLLILDIRKVLCRSFSIFIQYILLTIMKNTYQIALFHSFRSWNIKTWKVTTI